MPLSEHIVIVATQVYILPAFMPEFYKVLIVMFELNISEHYNIIQYYVS